MKGCGISKMKSIDIVCLYKAKKEEEIEQRYL